MRTIRVTAAALVATLSLACSKSDPPGSPPGDAPVPPPEDPPVVHPLEEGQFRIVTWNIRFFPEPGTDVDRTADYLVALDADVVGVQEIADRSALASLLADVNARLAELPPAGNRPIRSYDFVLAASGGHGGQYVGFIYDANAVDLSAIETLRRLQMNPDLRPALYTRATSLRGGTDFQVIVVHNDSGTDDRDYQNRLRFLDSLNVELADRRPADADIVVLGDLNDFQFSSALQTLKGGVLTNLIDILVPNDQYTYIFDGNSQVLDHILISQGLVNRLTGIDIVHANAEYEASVIQSDHDPAVAQFDFPLLTNGDGCYLVALFGTPYTGPATVVSMGESGYSSGRFRADKWGRTFDLPADACYEVHGTDDKDVILGDNGNDTLYGYAGDDVLVGQKGDDVFIGGPGADQFNGNDGIDEVLDYEPGVDFCDNIEIGCG